MTVRDRAASRESVAFTVSGTVPHPHVIVVYSGHDYDDDGR
jgi:hypothetical protein